MGSEDDDDSWPPHCPACGQPVQVAWPENPSIEKTVGSENPLLRGGEVLLDTRCSNSACSLFGVNLAERET